ncbi:hypothetical protein E1A91_D03G051800v1 [Gossypium mustelinum]|uniref:Uncharacterized protein n=1 Tax=Gossypium mustelinum TaxID=34275 RepID=A0A5D2VIX3_GOSMU|nr:hypothetical protein E1A91_D03G051800v1 [Gossypium mustelinum]
MMINQRLVSQKHSQWPPESFRLSPGLRASAVLLLPWMSETFFNPVWPPESFRFSPGLRACAAFILPWMSETFYYIFIIVSHFKYNFVIEIQLYSVRRSF